MRIALEKFIFRARWMLYPINVGLIIALAIYVGAFLYDDYHFIRYDLTANMESLMVMLLGLVDASMVANLIIMIVQGGHQIFIHKFDLEDKELIPQYLDHLDTGILKIKVALSISSITLVQILKDFVNIEHVDWVLAMRRIVIHGIALLSALVMALIWRVTHPTAHVAQEKEESHAH